MSIRFEVALVVLITLGAAFYTRVEYVPTWADRHVDLAEERMGLKVGDPPPLFSAWSLGDGQAFAVIAADPTGSRLAKVVGEPTYRFSRAGFGWLAWALSLGRERWVPYSMAAAGALAITANLALAIHLRDRLGPKTWLLILNPAIYLAFGGDTAESLGAFFLALAMATGSRWGAVALGVTRPSYLVALLRRPRVFAWGLAAAALLASYGLVRFGFDLTQFGGRLGLPLVGYLDEPNPLSLLVALLALGTLVIGIRQRDWSWIVAGVFVLGFTSAVVENPVNAWRAAGMLPVLWAFGPNYVPMAASDPVGESAPAVS